jgi:molybdopterin converting factor small subunit
MLVHVRLFSHFRERLPREAGGAATVDLPDGATVEHLLARLDIADRVKLISINNEPESDRQRVLYDGDAIQIFPPVVGG